MSSKVNQKESSQSPKPPKKPKKIEAQAPAEPVNRDSKLTVVGIGASAGGLNALHSFFAALPSDTGLSFVVVTHLHPEHESHMAELLQKSTRMPTMQVTDRTRVEPNHVYVIPPNRRILMTNSHLDLSEFEEPHGHRTPIDHFFRSMALSGHADPVAIVLSGSGTDGSVGIKDIKEVGGLIMVQHPQDAEYDGMPRAAMTTGLVDIILPAAGLAQKLAEYARHRPALPHDPGQLSDADNEALQHILGQVHARTGHDFSQYKRSTVLRRIERRMQLNGFHTLETYLEYLRGNSTESQAVFSDILIGVTNFFRDHDAWAALEKEIIPKLLEQNERHSNTGVRVWSIGCATGEEAYGIAMLLYEAAARQDIRPQIQVFASDLDERSIAYAREGLYPAAIEADVSPERLERFFIREGEYYRVKRQIRDAVLFTNHNVMRDPPFSRQHLISCRNVLIYLQRPIQDRIFDIFHYSLNPDGYLFLGSSESADHLPDLFHVLDKGHRIYQAKPWLGDRTRIPSIPFAVRRMTRDSKASTTGSAPYSQHAGESLALEEKHRHSLEAFGPPSILVNEDYTIIHVSETAGRYLLQRKGPVSADVLMSVRPELQLELRTALFQAFEKGKAIVSHPVAVQFNGHANRVVISVHPRQETLGANQPAERLALVFFLEDELADPAETRESLEALHSDSELSEMIVQLQGEIQRLREQLQITTEEFESSNEEMKASNEELQSINEEYRSATEELETSKEELQSVNEELQTVNTEMRNKLDETVRFRQELENLMGATDIPTLYLDREMRIQRFTAGVPEIFNILNVDRGRRISDLTNRMQYHDFIEDAEQVLRSLVPLERELQRTDGRWFLMRIRPYRTSVDIIEGVVISFVEITKLKDAEEQLVHAKENLEQRVQERTVELDEANIQSRHARDLFFKLFDSNPIPTALIRIRDDVFMHVNTQFLAFFDLRLEDVIGRSADRFNLGLGILKRERADLVTRLQAEGGIQNYEGEVKFPSGDIIYILASMQTIKLENEDTIITTFIDITERVRAEREIRLLASDLTVAEQEERRRISQILHDDLQQRIFAVKMQTAMLRDAYQKGNLQNAHVDFDQLEEALTESIVIARNLSIDLSPAVLQGEGLADALNWLAAQMLEQYGLEVTIRTNGVPTRFDDTIRILLFQAVREALFNVVKHANTSQADISIRENNAAIAITISDDGKGFEPAGTFEQQSSGGLMNIRHRLNLMGCKMSVESQPGKGTRVVLTVPARQAGS